MASFLIQSGASITLKDSKSQKPVDLVLGPVAQANGKEQNFVVFTVWEKHYEHFNRKSWVAAVISTGDVYMWDRKKGSDKLPVPTRLLGLKRATSISVGETHLLVVGSLYHLAYFPSVGAKAQNVEVKNGKHELGELDNSFMFNDMEFDNVLSSVQHDVPTGRAVPSLKVYARESRRNV